MRSSTRAVLLALSLALPLAPARAAAGAPRPPDKCPVCGMFVAKFPAWVAGAALRDGTRLWFDGAKDLFKFWLEPARFQPGRLREEVVALTVTDYYAVAPVDARSASYVIGSDAHGPMGRELVPFARREEAEEFLRDHHGSRILRFGDVTPELLRALDEE